MTTQLSLYNGALRLLGERKLGSLSENREPRYLLDDVWADNGVRYCLEQGQWNHAMRTSSLEYDSGVEPDFGYSRAFAKPGDFVRLAGISDNDQFAGPFDRYEDESGYWFADVDTLYLRYVSDGTGFGLDLSLWPETFTRYVQAHFAAEISRRLTSGASKTRDIEALAQRRLTDARSKDAMNEPTRYPPRGNWVRARHGGRPGDRGSRDTLIG